MIQFKSFYVWLKHVNLVRAPSAAITAQCYCFSGGMDLRHSINYVSPCDPTHIVPQCINCMFGHSLWYELYYCVLEGVTQTHIHISAIWHQWWSLCCFATAFMRVHHTLTHNAYELTEHVCFSELSSNDWNFGFPCLLFPICDEDNIQQTQVQYLLFCMFCTFQSLT